MTSQQVVDGLRSDVRGEVIAVGDPGYDEARKVYNGMIDKHPTAVVRCNGPADVAAVIGVARDEGYDLSVRGGAHSAPGLRHQRRRARHRPQPVCRTSSSTRTARPRAPAAGAPGRCSTTPRTPTASPRPAASSARPASPA